MASTTSTQSPVYVYELPVRIWHSINGLVLVVLAITGYLIASPPVVTEGDASENYLMGYIRFTHFSAAYILTLAFLGRAYWALVGNQYAKELFVVPMHKLEWWKGLWHEVQWYLFLVPESEKYVGHNPLASLALFLFYVLGTVFMIVTGFALYSEGLGLGSWADHWFGWVIPLFGQSQTVHTWHHLGMWYLVVFSIIHIYIVIREQLVSRQSMIATIMTGWRTWKDDRP